MTLFAAEAAAMFALCAATSIPAVSSASAASVEHLKAASSMSVDRAPNYGRLYEPGPDGEDGDLHSRDERERDREHDANRNRQQDDTAVRVKVRQHTKSNSRHRSGHEHYRPPVCFHCHHRHYRAKPRVYRAPVQQALPVTGGNSTRMAVGGGAAVLTGVVLLWLSSVRRRELTGSKSAAGAAA
ncbi:hypothetical protein ACRYCC_00050 [Actinomadura scrupuli]|uniref:hypothetical protein n=1 Tax=Actinomadura scrupuli TaxID=559629 RepID=UPI003D9603E1